MLRIPAVAAFATLLSACGSGGGEVDPTAAEWFPIGTWLIGDSDPDIEALLDGSFLIVGPPADGLPYDPKVPNPGRDLSIVILQPYTLNNGDIIKCYRTSSPQSYLENDAFGFNALHDPEADGPVFVKQYLAEESDFSGSISQDVGLTTFISLEDRGGNLFRTILLKAQPYTNPANSAHPALQQVVNEFNVRSNCHVGGFNDDFTGVQLADQLVGIQQQGRKVLDLKRRPLPVGREYQMNNAEGFRVLSENDDRATVSFTGKDNITRTASGTYSVKNGVEYWMLDGELIATEEYYIPGTGGFEYDTGIYTPPTRSTRIASRMIGFGMPTGYPQRFPDFVSRDFFPDFMLVDGTHFYYDGCGVCEAPIYEAYFDTGEDSGPRVEVVHD